MTLLLLEALGALVLLVLIVWWTMFSGRKNGELPQVQPSPDALTPGNNDLTKSGTDPAEAVVNTGLVEPTEARKNG